ncbi:MAG: hypothetical protein AABX12_04920 [Nanoarchaeota archaeon]
MKNKENNIKQSRHEHLKAHRKKPLSLTLITVWMGFMIFRIFLKLFDINRLERNASVLGDMLAYVNYFIDAFILLMFVVLICLFLFKHRNAGKYFIGLMAILIIGNFLGLFYLPASLALFPPESQGFMSVFLILASILIALFYAFLAYVVYRKRGYFDK